MKEKILSTFQKLKSVTKTAKELSLPFETVRYYLRNYGNLNCLHPSKNCLDEAEDLYLEGKTLKEISELLGFSSSCLRSHLKKRGVIFRNLTDYKTHSVELNYFEKIDTKDKAYWLGWMASDGYNNIKKYQITLKLQSSDSEVLEKLKQNIKFTGNIKIVERKKKIHISGVETIANSYAILNICSKNLSLCLEKLGIVPDKAYTFLVPNINKELLSSFYRGFIEGDGCFYCNENSNSYKISVIMSEKLAIQTKKLLSFLEIDFNFKPKFKNSLGELALYKTSDCVKFIDFLYEDCGEMFLTRKLKKAQEMKFFLIQKKKE